MENQIIKTIKDIQLLQCGAEVGTAVLDTIGKIVPIGSILKNGFKAIDSIRDYHFFKKLESFLTPLQYLADDETKAFLDSLGKENERVADYIYTILDHSEEKEKAYVLGVLYKAAVERKIDVELMLRYSSIISRSFISDLKHLPDYIESIDESSDLTNIFMSLGLMDMPMVGVWHDHPSYQLNELGYKLYDILNDENWFKH